MNNKKYIIEILKSVLLCTLIPNIFLFIFWKFDNDFTFIPILTLFFNSIILPFTLIIVAKNVNENHDKNWWYLNYFIFALCVISSIFLNLGNWILSVEKVDGFYGRNNIDSGTWMIINLEIMASMIILGIGLIYEIFKNFSNENIKQENE